MDLLKTLGKICRIFVICNFLLDQGVEFNFIIKKIKEKKIPKHDRYRSIDTLVKKVFKPNFKKLSNAKHKAFVSPTQKL